jgi:hypothetical protein
VFGKNAESPPDGFFRQATNPTKMWVDTVNGADQGVYFGCRYANPVGREHFVLLTIPRKISATTKMCPLNPSIRRA